MSEKTVTSMVLYDGGGLSLRDGLKIKSHDGMVLTVSHVPGKQSHDWWVLDHPLGEIPLFGNYLLMNGAPWTVVS